MLDRPSHTILVVDDHAGNRYALVRALGGAGYRVIESSTGEQALEQAACASLVVLDVHLPGIDGFEVCRRLRERETGQDQPILHVSSVYITGFSEAQGRRNGADGYLVRPVSPDVLVRTVDELLERAPPRA